MNKTVKGPQSAILNQAADNISESLKKLGFLATKDPESEREWSIKLDMDPMGKILVYAKASGVTIVRFHEIKDAGVRAVLASRFSFIVEGAK